MPPKAKISREMIIEAGLNVVRRDGQGELNVRKVAAELGCSTQPVMYHYKTVDELKADVYTAADEMHTRYITSDVESAGNPLMSLGLRYIRFAQEEKHLFRFLFQTDKFRNRSFAEVLAADGADPVIQSVCAASGLEPEQAAEVFAQLFICVHGAASLLANNSIEYDEKYFKELLDKAFFGAIAAVKGRK